ncbi:PTS transporter subunit EIIC [Anaerolactibacter massiliensis]|uniref:PTS transporter subunit EIIC n=1 Tax=Anaerolactibacter massiliensis TaxID=2044573 RepID=UPI000CF8D141|nr:PTS transporter subunit EIIC [Anaerolactibacter massiliensis]
MAKDYKNLAETIVSDLGGLENIDQVIHCATRLRFQLKDAKKAETEEIKKIPGVLGVQNSGGQYQVLIGTDVGEVFDEVVKAGVADGGTDFSDAEEPEAKKSLIDRFMTMISEVMSPYIPILATAGIIGGIISLLASMGVMNSEGLTYQAFYAAANSVFYFFPILLGFTAGKHFKCNPYVSAVLGASLVYPNLANMIVSGTQVQMFGINFTAASFSGTFIPILLAVWVMSHLEKGLKKVLPQVVQFTFVPLLCLAIMVPLTIMVIGPISGVLATAISAAYKALFIYPLIGCVLFGAFFIVIIMLGLHWSVIPIQLAVLAEQGYEYGLSAGGMGNYALLGVCLGVLFASKNAKKRQVAGSAAFVDALSGITEPGLYGIVMTNKRYLISLIVGGAAGGLIIGLFDVPTIQFAFSGILSFGAYLTIPKFPIYITAIVVSIAVSCAVSMLTTKRIEAK